MINAQIGITPPALARPARLRADRIRRDTLTQLCAALAEDHDSTLQNALDELVQAMKDGATDNEIDTLVGDIEDAAHMDDAVMDITPGDVRQLAAQADAALPKPAGTVVDLPRQQDRRAS